jgi:alkylation response protein AidB-like acyl-CoA dehydrogenase
MDFGLSEEQQELKRSARDFLTQECTTARVREIMADDQGMPRDLYAEMARLGWNGLLVPDQLGGAGLGMLDMILLLEECGYAALPGPFLFSSALAASMLDAGGSDDLKERWLRPLAEGRAFGTVAVVEANDSLNPADLATTAHPAGGGWVLSGSKMFVPYANVADFVIVAARTGDAARDVGLFVVEPNRTNIRRLMNLDLTRRVYAMELEGVQVPAEAALAGGSGLYDRLVDVAAIAIAADSLGGLERALDMAVEYSKIREQFGKPIGAYQALQHAAAEIVADLEPARPLLWYAAYALDSPLAAGSSSMDASRAAAMVKARMCDIFMRGADRAVLMHGGIGFTWEHEIHLWFKRARFNESYFGAPAFHRERVAALGNY